MDSTQIDALFTPETLTQLFPHDRTNDFFEALFGDANDGAYDITLGYGGCTNNQIRLELRLHERPGCCLACNLTQGLPQVFSRHPIINVEGLVQSVDDLLGDTAQCGDWQLGSTEQCQKDLHLIPLNIQLT
ncbi:MAG: pancreas/duodenum homeobox protein 1 [Desulfobulbaceae bacterium]|uniref:Pancreas/duodenum homeobox protein 1 n=1 Tax=Candidatus Desulfatifera sulfidica TaxID=2841691 RepID=A0A8J6N7S5_9BACT|nr:pancreas/duodenum homeobox protein 1 [Candidatus Desulfatifera sulfidica]